jgi:hypothetical protein
MLSVMCEFLERGYVLMSTRVFENQLASVPDSVSLTSPVFLRGDENPKLTIFFMFSWSMLVSLSFFVLVTS